MKTAYICSPYKGETERNVEYANQSEVRRIGGNMLELNGFYNMDCMDGMKQFPDKFFELAIDKCTYL